MVSKRLISVKEFRSIYIAPDRERIPMACYENPVTIFQTGRFRASAVGELLNFHAEQRQ